MALGARGPIPDLRQQFLAVRWRFRTGSPWRDLPPEYGPRPTAHTGSAHGRCACVLERLMQAGTRGGTAADRR
ncbi:transposase [Nonomuraea aridisoli]|uniref:transposase n=1 Tax=Nonomuraea aridisoli TaxID=2070368 RepID=UPI0015E8AF94